MSAAELAVATLPERLIAWPSTAAAATTDEHVAWQWWWQNDDMQWHEYHPTLNTRLEAAFVAHEPSVTLSHGTESYEVNFQTMLQRNRRSEFQRRVKRVPTSCVQDVAIIISSPSEVPGTAEMTQKQMLDMLRVAPSSHPTAECCVCMSDGDDEIDNTKQDSGCLTLACGHVAHAGCLLSWIRINPTCPTCRVSLFSVLVGNQPAGTMSIRLSAPGTVAIGGSMSTGVIEMVYDFPAVVHGGAYVDGTSRITYLPDTPEGRAVCELMAHAFRRRLVFTIGRSVTTGMDVAITWRIHHKTSLSAGVYGYPDAGYLTRVTAELLEVLPDATAAARTA